MDARHDVLYCRESFEIRCPRLRLFFAWPALSKTRVIPVSGADVDCESYPEVLRS